MKSSLALRGKWRAEHRDKHGTLIAILSITNLIVDEGINFLLQNGIPGGSNLMSGWTADFVDAAGFSGFLASDTHAVHPGWTNFGGVFPAVPAMTWGSASARANVATSALLTFTVGATLKGFAMVFQPTGGGLPLLWAEGPFDTGDQIVSASDTMTLTYTLAG